MKRFLAVAAAVAMIVVAIAIRSGIDNGGGGGTVSTPSRPRIACAPELETWCRSLTNVELHIEDASVTARAVASGSAQLDGWVTFDPWPEMVNELAGHAATHGTAHLAETPLVIAMVAERSAALAPRCGGTVNWKCLGDAIGKQWIEVGGKAEWGTVKAGFPPISSALGVVMLANAASGYFGRVDFATNDFDTDFALWRSKVTETPATFADFILKFPAAFSAVGTTQVEVTRGVASRPVATIVPSPSAAVTVSLTAIGDHDLPSRLVDQLTKALRTDGWGQPTSPTLKHDLPEVGVLLALSGLTG